MFLISAFNGIDPLHVRDAKKSLEIADEERLSADISNRIRFFSTLDHSRHYCDVDRHFASQTTKTAMEMWYLVLLKNPHLGVMSIAEMSQSDMGVISVFCFLAIFSKFFLFSEKMVKKLARKQKMDKVIS